MVEGGAGTIARGLPTRWATRCASTPPSARSPNATITCVVDTDELTVSARHVVVTAPPGLTLEIAFDPVLPDDRLTLYRNSVAGPESKTLIVYDEPFWRGDGFSGQIRRAALRRRGHARRGTGVGIARRHRLVHVRAGGRARRRPRRRRAAPGRARRAHSPVRTAGRVTQRVHRDAMVEGTVDAGVLDGASAAKDPHPVTDRYIREPFGRVHWAGTETSTTSHGAIDGAVRSGERAAVGGPRSSVVEP